MGPIRVRYGSIRVQFWIFGVKYPVPFTYLQILVQVQVGSLRIRSGLDNPFKLLINFKIYYIL